MERRQKNDLSEIGSVLEIAEINWRLHPLLCMFEIFDGNTFKKFIFC